MHGAYFRLRRKTTTCRLGAEMLSMESASVRVRGWS
jgi:hypothetical protein